NYIGVSETPEQIYGKTMSIPDRLLEKYVRLTSGMPRAEMGEVLALKPRDAKAALARRLVERLHGEEAAARAEKDFETKFRRREVPEDVPERSVTELEDLPGAAVEAGPAGSRGDARRLIEQGGAGV